MSRTRGAARTSRPARGRPAAGARRGTRRRACPSTTGASRMEEERAVEPGGHISQRSGRGRRDGHDPRLAVLRGLLASLAIERVPDGHLSTRQVDVVATDARELTGTATDVAEEQVDRAELRTVFAKRRHRRV